MPSSNSLIDPEEIKSALNKTSGNFQNMMPLTQLPRAPSDSYLSVQRSSQDLTGILGSGETIFKQDFSNTQFLGAPEE